ncbi:MAG: AAA family ATPase, partial [Sphaerospermopsis kisseleviana]
MKLIIKNLGPIKNNTQAIDLSKDFFVFVGRNNSGKSYVAQLLWAIFNQDIINKFALENLEIIDNEIVENVNKVEVTPELIGKILSRYSNFLQEETKKEIFNTGKEATIFNKIAINFDYEISELKDEKIEATVYIKKDEEENSLEYIEIKKDQGDLIYSFEEKDLPESFQEIFPKRFLDRNLLNQKKSIL